MGRRFLAGPALAEGTCLSDLLDECEEELFGAVHRARHVRIRSVVEVAVVAARPREVLLERRRPVVAVEVLPLQSDRRERVQVVVDVEVRDERDAADATVSERALAGADQLRTEPWSA